MTHPHDISKIANDPRLKSALSKFGKGFTIGDIGKVVKSLTTPITIQPVGPGVPVRPVKGVPVGPGQPVNAFREALQRRKKQPRSPNTPTQLRAGAQAFRIRSNF